MQEQDLLAAISRAGKLQEWAMYGILICPGIFTSCPVQVPMRMSGYVPTSLLSLFRGALFTFACPMCSVMQGKHAELMFATCWHQY